MRLSYAAWLVVFVLSATAGQADAARPVRLRFPSFEVPPGTSVEACYVVRVATSAPIDLSEWTLRNRGAGGGFAPLHFLAYHYLGERAAEFGASEGGVIFSRACLDFGPPDRDRRLIIASGTAPVNARALPAGVALRLDPSPSTPGGPAESIVFVLAANWSNAATKARRASAVLTLRRARPGSVRRLAIPFYERTAETALAVPPDQVVSTETSTAAFNAARPGDPPLRDAWGTGVPGGPSGDACVIDLTARLHKRGRFFGVDLLGADGLPRNPPVGTVNPFAPSRSHLFGAFDYTDPGVITFTPARLLRAGESLHYACWSDNGSAVTMRLGCEEAPGVAPGIAAGAPGGGPAKPCHVVGPNPVDCPTTDPAFPGRTFTGECALANLVAGSEPDDEVCALTGFFYDAVAGAPAGSECDLTGLPAIL
jgi:hypothetical protein